MAVLAIARRLAASRPAAAVADLLERLVAGRPDSLAVLTFHRVADPGADVPPGLLSATPEGFAELVEVIARRHEVVSIDDVLRRAGGGDALRPRSLLLTFDDAYADVADHAWPALRERGLPAVLFVPTAYPDAPDRVFWWERVHRAITSTARPSVAVPAGGELPLTSPAERGRAYRAVRDALKAMPHEELIGAVERLVGDLGGDRPGATVLGWDALRRLAGEGLALAPHTRTHPLLPRLDPAELDAEIAGSRADLARETGSRVPAFAYPSGAASPASVRAVRAAGFTVAFTTARGVNDLRSANRLLLRRVNVSVRTPLAALRAQVLR
ncbi:MAG TPA: polysaccharide deacetylase family protein [Candidatus Limnocylindrales bacterium]|nr:polysaccharide deacetylase family protein [Candidatus Limnocylindrales bacterium]